MYRCKTIYLRNIKGVPIFQELLYFYIGCVICYEEWRMPKGKIRGHRQTALVFLHFLLGFCQLVAIFYCFSGLVAHISWKVYIFVRLLLLGFLKYP